MVSLTELKAQILKDGRVTKDEALQLVEVIMRGTITQRDRREVHELLVDFGASLEPGARDALEQVLGISSRQKLVRAPAVRDDAELEPLKKCLTLVYAAGGKPTLFELNVGDQHENRAFRGALSDALKHFIETGKSSLTAAEATTLAAGLSSGHFVDTPDALYHAGDRLAVTVHSPDGAQHPTQGLVVSSGQSPLVLVVNKNRRYQMIRQDPKSKDQLAVRAILAGAAAPAPKAPPQQ
jgi:hypothetical protein